MHRFRVCKVDLRLRKDSDYRADHTICLISVLYFNLYLFNSCFSFLIPLNQHLSSDIFSHFNLFFSSMNH